MSDPVVPVARPEAPTAKWWVVDHFRDDVVVSGPWDTAVDAARDRVRLERDDRYAEEANLWIIGGPA